VYEAFALMRGANEAVPGWVGALMGRDEVDTSLEAQMGVGFEVFTPEFA
jgi:hypothetical protein